MATAKRMTKAQIIGELSEKTGLAKKEVTNVFENLRELVKRELGKRNGPGEFVIPDLIKLKVKKVKATPAGRRLNPFTKEMKDYPAKPASKKVRATPLKKLKDLIQ